MQKNQSTTTDEFIDIDNDRLRNKLAVALAHKHHCIDDVLEEITEAKNHSAGVERQYMQDMLNLARRCLYTQAGAWEKAQDTKVRKNLQKESFRRFIMAIIQAAVAPFIALIVYLASRGG